MTAAAFSKLLDHFDPQDPQQATALEALVGTYPHFQTALICSAKAQLAQEKLSAESALQKAAIATLALASSIASSTTSKPADSISVTFSGVIKSSISCT